MPRRPSTGLPSLVVKRDDPGGLLLPPESLVVSNADVRHPSLNTDVSETIPLNTETETDTENNDIEDLRSQIAACHSRHHDLSKKIESFHASHDEKLKRLSTSITTSGPGHFPAESRRDYVLPRDTYSFFSSDDYFSPGMLPRPRLAFACAMGVMIVQVCTMSLLAVDVIDIENTDNHLGIPPGVDLTVRITQLLAILITVVSQDEVRLSLNVLSNGYDLDSLRSLYSGVSRTKWYFSLASRFLVGCLGLAVTFMLIVRADTVRDLLLNFTAVEFVSHLDNGLFALVKWGYTGDQAQQVAEKIALTELSAEASLPIWKGRILRAFFLIAIFFTLLGFWLWISLTQQGGHFLCQTIYVQFGDEFSPTLGAFSGLYDLSTAGTLFGSRAEYSLRYPGLFAETARFAYCAGNKMFWTFTFGETASAVPSACDFRAKSPQSFSFDITATSTSQWSVRDADTDRTLPLQRFLMTCQEDFFGKECSAATDCGSKFSCEAGICVCPEDWYGMNCEFRKPCETIEIDTEFDGFADSRPRSTRYDIVRDPVTNALVQVYNRPVYLSDKTAEGSKDIIFFTGRRWVLTNTDRFEFFNEPQMIVDDATIASYMGSGFHAHFSNYTVLFITEPVDVDTPTDSATPVGLRWFHAEAAKVSRSVMQRPDTNRLSGAVLLCAVCNEDSNPCLFGNVCIDGTCECTTGSSGTLCQTVPISNGRCDSFFNNAEYQYDGGDCCQTTCTSTEEHSCGILGDTGLNVRKYTGYSQCEDPSQLCAPTMDTCWNQLFRVSGSSVVALSGNGAVMVVASEDHIVQVLEQDGFQWIPRGSPFDNSEIGVLGPRTSVAISDDGSVFAVGLPVDGDVLPEGIVRVFRWEARSKMYSQIGDDISVQAVNFGVAHGASVALTSDGTTLLIGAPDSFTSVSIGYVLVYEYNFITTSWIQLGTRIEGNEEDDDFGASISLSNDGTIFAASSPQVGYVRIYKYNRLTTDWSQIGHIEGDASDDYFGNSVSLSRDGQILAVGAPRAPIGYVEVFKYNGTSATWTQRGKIIGQEDSDYFGVALSLSSNGKFLAIGSDLADSMNGPNSGSVKTYKYDQMVGWAPHGQTLEGEEPFVGFGSSLSLSSDAQTLAVGNESNRLRENSVGSVTIYRLETSSIKDSETSERPPQEAVAISVALQLDSFPEQTGISLWCGDISYSQVTIGGFEKVNQIRYETFLVENGTDCEFTIIDSSGDGICCAYGEGSYKIYYGDDMSNKENLLAVGGQIFGPQERVRFTVSPPTTLVPITVVLAPGMYGGEDTDFHLSCGVSLETELLTEAAFRSRGAITTDTFLVPNRTDCVFTMTDLNSQSGGSYGIYYGENTTDQNNVLAATERIGFGEQVIFAAGPPNTLPLPTVSNLCFIRVFMRLDDFPEETGWSLFCDEKLVFAASPGLYKEANSNIYENFFVANGTVCQYVITDTFGDGLSGSYRVGIGYDTELIDREGFDGFNVTHNFTASYVYSERRQF